MQFIDYRVLEGLRNNQMIEFNYYHLIFDTKTWRNLTVFYSFRIAELEIYNYTVNKNFIVKKIIEEIKC